MEVLASVSAAVPVALLLAEKVLEYLNERGSYRSAQNVRQLKSWLSEFQAFVKEKEKQPKNHLSEDLVNKIRQITAKIEDAFDDFMFDVADHSLRPVPQLSIWFHKHHIDKDIQGEKLLDRLRETPSVSAALVLEEDSSSDQFLKEDQIVGFTTRREELRSQLIKGDLKRRTIQVVGPGGSGKKFLVKNIFFDQQVERHFHCRVRITLSRSYSTGQRTAQKVLDHHIYPTSNSDQIVDEAGVLDTTKLRSYLDQKRYLIVLNNVWSRQAFTQIVNSLPNEDTGSRVIITSRNSDVADQPDFTHKLDGLIEEEAKELFCVRAFPGRQDRSIPDNLKPVSEKILKKCDGLPLVIAAVGSLLSEKPWVEHVWEKFYDSLASEIGSNSRLPIISSVLQPSFLDLPDNLRSCFLYFSIFPEGQSVSRGRLIRSWLAEGFVEERIGRTQEEVAETYLNELIKRSLVRASTSEVDGRVRTCHVLRFYHEFIVPLSGDGNFVTVVNDKWKPASPSEKVRRLSFHENFPTKLSEISDSEHVRTLFAFGHMDDARIDMTSFSYRMKSKIKRSSTTESQDLKKVFNKFRLLKVLDLEEVPLQKLPENIGSFVLLKCLNLRRTKIDTVPDSIKKLQLLETLDLKYTLVKELPKWIHKLQKLRHLLVSDNSSGEAQGAKVSSGIGSLLSLQKVSLIVVDNHDVIKKLGSFVELRQLGLADLQPNFGRELCETIQKMKKLSKFDVRAKTGELLELDHMESPPQNIQRLHLKGRLTRLPSWLSLLSSLIKIVLKGSRLKHHQNTLEILESLPSLMELEMVDYYIGEKLVFKPRTFMSLRKLHVEQFDGLTEVVVGNTALAMLKKLTICKCKQLKPLTRYSLRHLEELIVYEMSDAFFYDIQRRINGGELVDHIQKSYDDPSSSSTTNHEIRSYRHIS